MQSNTTRIAVLSHRESVHERQLLAGASKAACPENGFIVRDFLVDDTSSLPEKLISWQPAGAICCLGNRRAPLLDQLQSIGCKVVDTKPGGMETVAVVQPDLDSYFDTIYQHFSGIGRTEVVMFTVENCQDSKSLTAYCETYQNYTDSRNFAYRCIRLPDDLEHLEDPSGMTVVPEFVAQHLRSMGKKSGLFTNRRFLGGYLCRACELLGIKVPEDIAVVGADGFDQALRYVPTLTTVELPAMEMGYEAAKIFARVKDGGEWPTDPVHVPCSRLFVRRSTVMRKEDGCDIPAAVKFIDDRGCDRITVEDVIQHTQGVSRDTFEKRFVEMTGNRPSEAIRQRKLREAKRLLSESSISITRVADICGFCDDIYFRKVFKKAEKATPSSYRRLHQTAER